MKQDLELNCTRHYNPDHANLDNWDVIGKVEIFQNVIDDSDHEESVDIEAVALVSDLRIGTTKAHAEQAIRDMLVKGCSCEHDCCGCYFGGVRNFVWHGSRTARFELHYDRNY